MEKKIWHKGFPETEGRYWVYSQIPGENPVYRADEWTGRDWLLIDTKYVLYWSEIIPVEGNCDD